MKTLKKILFVFIVALMVVSPLSYVDAAKKEKATTTTVVAGDENAVAVSVFYSSTCPHCQALHAFLSELKKDDSINKMFNVVDYEVSEESNSDLWSKVAAYFDQETDGVPFFVIGQQYYSGYSESLNDTIKNKIKEVYADQSLNIDVVTGIKDGTITGKLSDTQDKSANNLVGVIILGVSVVVVIVLIVLSSKNKYYDEDEEEVEETKEDTKSKKKN